MSDELFNPDTLFRIVNNVDVLVTMGSDSDYVRDKGMIECCELLTRLGVQFDCFVTSMHRSPERVKMVADAIEGTKLVRCCAVICGAGGAAHLAGGFASFLYYTPVFGVPIKSDAMNGVDSLYSTVQMPAGVPVGTLAIGKAGGTNAAIMAAMVVARSNESVRNELITYREDLKKAVKDRP